MAYAASDELFELGSVNAQNTVYPLVKDLFDRMLAVVALALLAPVFLMIAAAIKTESKR